MAARTAVTMGHANPGHVGFGGPAPLFLGEYRPDISGEVSKVDDQF